MSTISIVYDGDQLNGTADRRAAAADGRANQRNGTADHQNGTADHSNEQNESPGIFEKSHSVAVELVRPVYFYKAEKLDHKDHHTSTATHHVKEFCCPRVSFCQFILSFLPALQWVPKYDWKGCLINDVLAGVTVGIMAISEGLAYAKLSGMPPISGLYTNTIPSLLYVVLGTCRHGIFGPLASLSLLTASVKDKHMHCETCLENFTSTGINPVQLVQDTPNMVPLELGSTIAFLVGCYLIVAGFLRLSFLTGYLSDQVVGGFTIGVAVHMISGQLGSIFGIHMPKRTGIGKAITNFVDLFRSIDQTNLATLEMFIVSFVLLVIIKIIINPRIQKKLRFQIPAELIVIAGGTISSYYGQLHAEFGVQITETIPRGLPPPTLPRFDLISTLWIDCIVPAIVTYALSISFAKTFAGRNEYKVDPAQELYAYGIMNVFGSFFQCLNVGQSMARSTVTERSGGKTQVAGLVAAIVGILVILFLAPYMEWLPSCILSSIVVMASFLILSHITEVKGLYRTSKFDLSAYVVTAVSVSALDISCGLAVGVVWALATVVVRSQMIKVVPMDPQIVSLHWTPITHSSDYVRNCMNNIKVTQISSPIFYANADAVRVRLLRIGESVCTDIDNWDIETCSDGTMTRMSIDTAESHILIIDIAAVPFIDPSGAKAINEVREELRKRDVSIFLSGCTASHHRILQHSLIPDSDNGTMLFPTLADALRYGEKIVMPQYDVFK